VALTFPVLAQTFDVASVRINRTGSAGGEGRTEENITSTPGSLIMKNVTLRSCVRWAYGVRDFQISVGPGWISTERYDISAKGNGGEGDARLRAMLRSLLTDRFQLSVREEVRQLPVYALTVLKIKPAMKRAVGAETSSMQPGDGALEFHNTSMTEFAERLGKRPLAVDRPVLDKTLLSGEYDFSLKFADNSAGLKGALEDIDRGGGASIFGIIQEQLGLRLRPQKAALRSLTIVRAVMNPGEN
jgi:uncharacterized protein (TIGR03435 family)